MRTALMYIGDPAPVNCSVDAKAFMKKVLRMRARLIAERKGNLTTTMLKNYTAVMNWYQFYSPSSDNCARYIRKNRAPIEMIIPGAGCAAHKSLMNELNLICQC